MFIVHSIKIRRQVGLTLARIYDHVLLNNKKKLDAVGGWLSCSAVIDDRRLSDECLNW